jgi:long-chain acyl-CoA synthetase
MNMPHVTFKRWWNNGESVRLPLESPPAAPEAAPAPQPPAEAPWLKQLDRAGIPRTLNYPSTTLGRILDQSADRFGDVTALIYNHKRWTYRELLEQVNRAAAGLAGLGVRRGERVLMTLPNCPESVICFFAVQKLGAIVVNAGPLMGQDDLRTVIAMTHPHVAIGLDLLAPALIRAAHGSTLEHFVWVSLQFYQSVLKRVGYQMKLWHNRGTNGSSVKHLPLTELLAHSPSRPPSVMPEGRHTAVLQPTGGTTGTLKLAQLSHAALLANATQVSTWMACRAGQERVLTILPTFHVYGLTLGLIAPIMSASTIVLVTRFDASETLELIERYRPTQFPLVPAACDALSDEIERRDGIAPIEGIRLCFSGAAPLPPQTAERFTRLTGVPVVEGYGLTEAAPVTHASLPGQPRPCSVGLPMPDTRVRVVDVETGQRDVAQGEPGELLVAGPQLMSGYYGDPEQSERTLVADEEGTVWLHTGDVVRYDAEGYLSVVDRKKDMIIRSGLKVYPGKVEKVLRGHKLVADVAVVGRADPVHTQVVVAVVAPTTMPADPRQAEAELRALCRAHLAPYEVPAHIEFIDKLPRSALGKLLKRDLREGPATTTTVETPPAVSASNNGHNGHEKEMQR